MIELKKQWAREPGRTARGEWWLIAPGHRSAPNRAYIGWPADDGTRTLYVWDYGISADPWEPFLTSTNLRTLKAIGRLEAVRRLHV